MNNPNKLNEISQETPASCRNDIVEVLKKTKKITIKAIADELGLKEEEKELPNGRKVKSINWLPDHLESVYKAVNRLRAESNIGKDDNVVIDGACPTFLLPTISHAFHPACTSVSYPQGGEGAALPLSGVSAEGEGQADDVSFNVEEKDAVVVVELSLSHPQIDVQAALQSLVAPAVPHGKGVLITGRGPVALATALAEAYAHKAPFVANFIPGKGYVVTISHDSKNPLGKLLD